MEIRNIRYFLAVAEELHFGRAAKRLNISQPPLSQQIMKFEEHLGAKLFVRDKRNVCLTTAGERLVEHGRSIMSLVDFAEKDIRATSLGKSGLISVGYVSPAMDGFLPAILRDFREEYPKVEIVLKQLSTNQQLEQLLDKTLNIGFLRLHGHTTQGLEVHPVHRENYHLIVPDNHRFSSRKRISIKDILTEPLLFFPRHIQPDLYDEWFKLFSDTGRRPNIVQEAESYTTIVALVTAGFGAGIVPQSTAQLKRSGLTSISIEGKTPELVISSCSLSNPNNPVLKNLLDHILKK